MKAANYTVKETPAYILLRDIGRWDKYLTITNAAELVVQELVERLAGRKLYYYDSEGELGQLLVKDGKFAGFNHIKPSALGEGIKIDMMAVKPCAHCGSKCHASYTCPQDPANES